MQHWSQQAVFYHIYPLGLCGAPLENDFDLPIVPRLAKVHDWLDHIQALGVNTLYIGPLFESSRHGYDAVDYYRVDRRLGSNETLQVLSADLHARGMRLVLDGVFNHVGRDFWAFQDVRAHRERSAYRDWFHNLRFEGRSPRDDPFQYEGWNGHYSLVKLNLHNPAVREHLFEAVRSWVREFQIDGLRLDAADCLDENFLKALGRFCRGLRPDFWLMGEFVHGDYRQWTNSQMLDSVTNYECYNGLHSSHVGRNFFEIAHLLKRQFGEVGVYRGVHLYNFADNHDVNRVASKLKNPAHLRTLYSLLFTMPGAPSIYYGSEWGIRGERNPLTDDALRPQLDLQELTYNPPEADLPGLIADLARVRAGSPALQHGDYQEVMVGNEQLVFRRRTEDEQVVVAINAGEEPAQLRFAARGRGEKLVDLLDAKYSTRKRDGLVSIEVGACRARILR